MRFFVHFDFDPILISAGKEQNIKKNCPRPPTAPNLSQKNFGDHPTKNDEKNPKSRPPPIGPIGGGLGLK